jgi:hypothetical protein
MKIKRYNQLNEGVWDLPSSPEEGQKYIDELQEYTNRVYNVFGDDDVMNGLQGALSRMKELLENIK